MAESSSSITSIIHHYQRSIQQSQNDQKRLLHCIGKLYRLPVNVEHLQETGIGKSVNALRKYDGEVGVAAVALVTKWKAMVAAEEEPAEINKTRETDEEAIENGGNEQNKNDDNKRTHSYSPNKDGNEIHRVDHIHKDSQRDTTKNHESKQHEHGQHKHSDGKRDKNMENIDSSSSRKHSNHREKNSSHNSSSSKHKINGGSSRHMNERERSENIRKSNDLQKSHKIVEIDHKDEEKMCDRAQDRHSEHSEKRSSDKHKNEHRKKTSASSSSQNSSAKKNERHSDEVKLQDKCEQLQQEKVVENEEKKSTSKEKDKQKNKLGEGNSDRKKIKNEKEKISGNKITKENEHGAKSTSSLYSMPPSPKPSTSAAAAGRKRHCNADNDGSQSNKVRKIIKDIVEENDDDGDDGIDSSMGANFADVLGMLNIPAKKAKKSLNSLKSSFTKSEANCKPKTSNISQKEATNKSSILKKDDAAKSPNSLLEKKPDLLSSSAKLKPLDASIALALPTISNNYKPMPLNQTVMDCVFNTSSSSKAAPPVRTLTDAEALSHGISSKTIRTKIYSGTKTGQIFQVPSLFDLCIRILQKNIDALEYTGGVPFDVLRAVLERATPMQLLTFENYNPYVMEDSDILWKQHCQRNYRTQKRQEMESWREMYLRCQEDQEHKLSVLAESIKQSQKVILAPVRKTQLAFVDSMVKPPRNILRKQEQFGTKSKLVATPASRVATLSGVIPNAANAGDKRLRVAANVRDAAQVSHAVSRPKKAPLMAKTLQFMRGRNKR